MNFLELINKCLIELNYREVGSWDALTLNDHKRLKDVISRLNAQICATDNWPFLQRYSTFELFAGTDKISVPISGMLDIICIDGYEYKYSPNYKSFLLGNPIGGCFSTYGELLYLPVFDKTVECEIFYNTDFSAVDSYGIEKKYLELEDDKSLIPEAFQETILVYGACMRLKSNPEHNKFKYWYSMYNDAMATMRAKSTATQRDTSRIIVERG